MHESFQTHGDSGLESQKPFPRIYCDYCDYYEKELIPQLKAKITKHLRLARLIKDYFYIHDIGCECCKVRNCGECMVCLILAYFVGEKNVKK